MKLKRKISRKIGPYWSYKLRLLLRDRKEQTRFKKRRKFYTQFLKSGDTYFDVGANYGNRIEPIIDKGLKIVAIEPQPQCLKYLRKVFGSRILTVNKGLGEKIEEREMFIANADTVSTFSKDWIKTTKESGRFDKCEWDKKMTVQMSTLDNLIQEYGKPQFIKIDVEGFELEVLNGLNHSINFISYEYAVPEQTEMVINCLNRLKNISPDIECNYSIGESMEWARKNWVSVEEMIKHIQTNEFVATSFGDMYVKKSSVPLNGLV